jgi:hypothetical protein
MVWLYTVKITKRRKFKNGCSKIITLKAVAQTTVAQKQLLKNSCPQNSCSKTVARLLYDLTDQSVEPDVPGSPLEVCVEGVVDDRLFVPRQAVQLRRPGPGPSSQSSENKNVFVIKSVKRFFPCQMLLKMQSYY